MKELKTIIPALNIDPAIFFLGTDEDIAQAEKAEQKQMEIFANIIFAENFVALECENWHGGKEILHHNSRGFSEFQLSYFDNFGNPVMHENFIPITGAITLQKVESKEVLLRCFMEKTFDSDLLLTILTQ